jgi:4-amino-4-deoxy-L-arabinose transferase-like glycosyltransferase
VSTAGWTRYHWVAVGLCLVAFVAASLIADLIFEQVPHLEDEVAYLFQAQVFSVGKAYVDAPFRTNCFFAPFVLDYQGRRFGKYPPGWPALLSLGVRMGSAWWVNAACAALTVALTFRLGREIHDPLTGAVAAVLAATSPFLLILSGSLMSHPSCLVFTTAFLWCFRRTCVGLGPKASWSFAAGVMLGCVFAIRSFTALAFAFPSGLYALWRLFRRHEWKRLWFMGLGFVPLALTVPMFNAIWTGDPLLSPYVLFWPYDRLGFGPGHGPLPEGNTVRIGLGEAIIAIGRLATHLHGWPALSLSFVVLLFAFKPRRFWDVLLVSTALSLILAYVLYWTNGDILGPRYTYEIASALFVLSAAGIVHVGRWTREKGGWRWRALCILLVSLMIVDAFVYLPWQFERYQGLFGITGQPKEILQQADLDNALVIVRDDRGWWDYAVAFSMNAPTRDGDVVYASECPPWTGRLLEQFAGRSVYYFDGQTVQPFAGQSMP